MDLLYPKWLAYMIFITSILGPTFLSQPTRDPETNSKFALENGCLEDEFPFGAHFQGRTVSFREGIATFATDWVFFLV